MLHRKLITTLLASLMSVSVSANQLFVGAGVNWSENTVERLFSPSVSNSNVGANIEGGFEFTIFDRFYVSPTLRYSYLGDYYSTDTGKNETLNIISLFISPGIYISDQFSVEAKTGLYRQAEHEDEDGALVGLGFGYHWTRNIAFNVDYTHYLSIFGSSTDEVSLVAQYRF